MTRTQKIALTYFRFDQTSIHCCKCRSQSTVYSTLAIGAYSHISVDWSLFHSTVAQVYILVAAWPIRLELQRFFNPLMNVTWFAQCRQNNWGFLRGHSWLPTLSKSNPSPHLWLVNWFLLPGKRLTFQVMGAASGRSDDPLPPLPSPFLASTQPLVVQPGCCMCQTLVMSPRACTS